MLPDWTKSGGIAAIQAVLNQRAAQGWVLRVVSGNVAYYDDVQTPPAARQAEPAPASTRQARA